MALVIFPSTNNVGGGRYYSEAMVTDFLKSAFPSRVLSGLTVSGSSGLTRSISAGNALVNGYFVKFDTATSVSFPASTTSYVVIRNSHDVSNKVTTSTIQVVTSAAAGDFLLYKSVASASSTVITEELIRFNSTTAQVLSGSIPLSEELTNIENSINTANTNITNLSNDKLDASEVTATKSANKVLRLNAQSKLVADVQGKSDTAGQADFAARVGNSSTNYTLNQNLNKTNDVTFNKMTASVSVTIGSNVITKDGSSSRLRVTTPSGFEVFVGAASKMIIDSSGNTSFAGTLTATKVYNAVFN